MKSTYDATSGIITITISKDDQAALNQVNSPIQTAEAVRGRSMKRAINNLKDLAEYNGHAVKEIRVVVQPLSAAYWIATAPVDAGAKGCPQETS